MLRYLVMIKCDMCQDVGEEIPYSSPYEMNIASLRSDLIARGWFISDYGIYTRCPRCNTQLANGIVPQTRKEIEKRKEAASFLGSIKTDRKAESSRLNGKKGGRPAKKKFAVES